MGAACEGLLKPVPSTASKIICLTDPFISPPGFNASENAEAVEFRCYYTRLNDGSAINLIWLINDTSTANLTLDGGISWNDTLNAENEQTYIKIRIHPTAKNSGTCLKCRACLPYDTEVESNKAVFRVQGM